MSPDGVIVLDDCNPRNAGRASEIPNGGAWNGDVWRAVALLRQTQPQWTVLTVDADQGVGLVWGFNSAARVISETERERFRGLPYTRLAADRSLVGLAQPPHAHTLRGKFIATARRYLD